jgi:4-hydroxybenzoate polyprenyltransferase
VFLAGKNSFLLYLKIARFDHWIKQLFIIPGMVFAFVLIKNDSIKYPEYIASLYIFLGFISTCFAASANYIINEWLDAGFDKYHPTKKNRPVVTVSLKPFYIIAEYLIFAVLGLAGAWFVSMHVFYTVLLLLSMGIVYNVPPVRFKEMPYIDVLSESLNNALRLLIGWFIITSEYLPPMSIVFGYWMGGAFLMAAKRFAEYRMIGDKEQAGLYRKSFKHYTEKSLLLSAFFYALLSVFFCGIFMIKYRIELLAAIPFLCGLFCIYLNICYKPDSSAQKPEKLFREKGLLLYVLFFIVLLVVLMFFNIPFLERFLETSFLGI